MPRGGTKKPFNEIVEGPDFHTIDIQHDRLLSRRLLDGVILQVLITLRKFRKFRLVVDALRHFETADATGNVGLDVGYGIDLLQSASDRGGTAISRHVGY